MLKVKLPYDNFAITTQQFSKTTDDRDMTCMSLFIRTLFAIVAKLWNHSWCLSADKQTKCDTRIYTHKDRFYLTIKNKMLFEWKWVELKFIK